MKSGDWSGSLDAPGADRLRVRRGRRQVLDPEVDVELLRHGVVRPGRRLVVDGQLEGDPGARAAADGDPVVRGP